MKRFNSYKVKGLGKRVLSVLLAVFTMLNCLIMGISAFADDLNRI